MRKIIAIVLALVMVMGMSTTAFAATGGSIKSTRITAYVYSSYEITIPAQVDLTETNNIITISVDSLNLDPDLILTVMLARYAVTHSNGDSTEIELYVNDVLKDNVLATFTEPGSVDIVVKFPDTALAGNYSGTITFDIDALLPDGITE